MGMTDPVGDLLSRIRNAIAVRKPEVIAESSKMKLWIAKILQSEGYIQNFEELSNAHRKTLILHLKYDQHKQCVIEGLKRESKPGRRFYVKSHQIPKVRNGLGIAILSTSKGVISDREARSRNLGGELICTVW